MPSEQINPLDTLDQGRDKINDHFSGIDPHEQYLKEADHTKANHDTMSINAATLGGNSASSFSMTNHRHLAYMNFSLPGTADTTIESSVGLTFTEGTIARVKAHARTAPTGGPLVLSIRRNNVEVATISFSAGSVEVTQDFTSSQIGILDTDNLSVSVKTPGLTNPGSGISVLIEINTSNIPLATGTNIYTINASGDDQRVRMQEAVYPPTVFNRLTSGTVGGPQRSFDGTNYIVSNFLMRWNTSTLSDDAIIHGAELRANVYVSGSSSILTRNITGDWYAWTGSSNADHSITPQTNALVIPMQYRPSNGLEWRIALDNAATGVSKTGVTSLRLHIDGGQPTQIHIVEFHTFDNTLAILPPRLVVPYSRY